MKEERKHKMQLIFKQHPQVKEFHVTSDDQAFYNASDAKNHAATLDDKEVDLIKRRDVLEEVKIEMKEVEVDGDERSVLMAKLEALGGKAAKNIGLDKLKDKIAELEAEQAESEKQKAESPGDAEQAEGEGAGE